MFTFDQWLEYLNTFGAGRNNRLNQAGGDRLRAEWKAIFEAGGQALHGLDLPDTYPLDPTPIEENSSGKWTSKAQ